MTSYALTEILNILSVEFTFVEPTSSFSCFPGTAGTFLLLSSCLVLVPCVSCCQHHVLMHPSLKYHSRFNSCSLKLSKASAAFWPCECHHWFLHLGFPESWKTTVGWTPTVSFRFFFRASWYRDRHLNIGSFLYNLCDLASQSLSFPIYKTERIEPARGHRGHCEDSETCSHLFVHRKYLHFIFSFP